MRSSRSSFSSSVIRTLAAKMTLPLFFLGLAGCGTGETDTGSNGDRFCVSNADCEPGEVCDGGFCAPDSERRPCTDDEDCGEGGLCVDGSCQTQGDQGECETDDDCGENAYCRTTETGSVCACKENYFPSGSGCAPETREVDCTNQRPANSSWKPGYYGGTLTQTWDGEAFVPPADTCEWGCNEGFHEHDMDGQPQCVQCATDAHCEEPEPICREELNICVECEDDDQCPSDEICHFNSCEPIVRTHFCEPKPDEGTEWNTVWHYEREWNPETETWEPEESATHYNEVPDDESCRYACIEGYRFNGEDCEVRPTCSSGDQLGSSVTAEDLLAGMGVCDFYDSNDEGSFGIVPGSARIVRANWPEDDGEVDPLQYGVKTQFGTHHSNYPKFGDNLTILSSGRARDAHDDDPTDDDSYSYETGEPPADFVAPHGGELPETREDCPNGDGANDSVNLRVEIKVPDFARAFSFDFRFFSQEYMNWTCSSFNDFFITMLDTDWEPEGDEQPIPADKNISFDSQGNYISVNSDQFFTVCQPKECSRSGAEYDCPGGTAPLNGTGYEPSNAGATDWLTTTAPVVPGETITLRFIIWDTSDRILDSLVLLDNFRWHAEQGDGPETKPVMP